MKLYELTASRLPLAYQGEMIFRIMLAMVCGGFVGVERGRRYKGAGIRTHSMVACTAAVLMVISKYGFTDLLDPNGVFFPGVGDADPARIAAQVVSGISFLGVGVIYRDRRNTTKGLTTAAGIWAVASIGMAMGAGMYLIGAVATVAVIVIQYLMHRIPLAQDRFGNQRLELVMQDDVELMKSVNELLAAHNASAVESRLRRTEDGILCCSMLLRMERKDSTAAITNKLLEDKRIRSVDWNEDEPA
ncbi:MAG: MgtC/SapB family protein [Oscillospiraceae bacterium]|nr:MgtC/SapB family protein [Oscillospiraceae bacterium]